MISNLTIEIIRRILADVGAVVGLSFGKAGLTESILKVAKPIEVDYDGETVNHDVFAGQLKIADSVLFGLLVNLTYDDDPEFLFLFRLDNYPIHALHLIYNDEEYDNCYFRKFDGEHEAWQDLSVYSQAKILSDFERFVSFGLLWEKSSNYQDLLEAAIKLI